MFLGKAHLGLRADIEQMISDGLAPKECRWQFRHFETALDAPHGSPRETNQSCVGLLYQHVIGADEVKEVYWNNYDMDAEGHHPESMAEEARRFIATNTAANKRFFVHM